MFEVIKGSNPFKNVVIEGEAVINNKIDGELPKKTDDVKEAEQTEDGEKVFVRRRRSGGGQ